MITVDAHAYVGPSLYGMDQTPESLLHLMDRCGVDKAVLCPNRPKDYALWPAIEAIAQAIKQHPDRFYGLARVDPWQGDGAVDSLRRAREKLGLHGLLPHPWEETFQVSDRILDPLVVYAAEHGMPVVIETGYPWVSHVLDVAELAQRHAKASIVATHGLQLDSSAFALVDGEMAMRRCDNLIMETSGMYAPELVETVVRQLGAHRVVFGSHTPWFDLQLEVQRARLLDLSTEQMEAVLGGNIERLLG